MRQIDTKDAKEETMIVVSVLYPRREGARFDHDYYRDQHFPLVARAYGDHLLHYMALKMQDEQLGDAPSPHVAAAHFLFESRREFLEAFEQHSDEIVADIQKFTDLDPVIEISDVRKTSVDVDGNENEGAKQ